MAGGFGFGGILLRRRLVVVGLLSALCCGALFASPTTNPDKDPVPNDLMPLSQFLEGLRRRGLPIVFSSDVVRPEMVAAPTSREEDPMEALRRALVRNGLDIKRGAGGTLLVIRVPYGSLAGRVVTADGTPLNSCRLTIIGPERQELLSDANGEFFISHLRTGRYRVAAYAPGFIAREIAGVHVGESEVARLALSLNPVPPLVTELTVTPGRFDIRNDSAAQTFDLSGREISDWPAAADDPLASLGRLPGVALGAETTAPTVRGSPARDVSLIVDGLEVYEPYHLATFQSPFSILDLGSVSRLELMSGAFPVDYGDRTGGIVRLETRPLPEDQGLEMSVGSLNSRIRFGSRIGGGRGSWSAFGRWWYPDSFTHTFRIGSDIPDPYLSDLRFSSRYEIRRSAVIEVSGLLMRDGLRLDLDESSDRLTFNAGGRYVWSRLLAELPGGGESETVISLGRISRDRVGRASSFARAETEMNVDDRRRVLFYGIRQSVSLLRPPTFYLRAGFEFRWLSAEYDYRRVSAGTSATDIGVDDSLQLRPAGSSHAAWIANRWSPSDRFAVEAGLRFDRQTYLEDSQTSPRVHFVWSPGSRSELKLAAGIFHQSQRIHELQVADGETTFARAQRARQVDLSWTFAPRNGLEFKLGAYGKRLSRLHPRYENLLDPFSLFPEVATDRVEILASGARARGLEASIRSHSRSGLSWEAAYSLARIEDREEQRWIPRAWDQRHSVSAGIQFRASERTRLSLSGRFHSGWATTPAFLAELDALSPEPANEAFAGPRNSARFPAFWQIDARGEWTFAVRRGRLHLQVNIANLLNRKNACCVEGFSFASSAEPGDSGRPVYGTYRGFMPSLSLAWER